MKLTPPLRHEVRNCYEVVHLYGGRIVCYVNAEDVDQARQFYNLLKGEKDPPSYELNFRFIRKTCSRYLLERFKEVSP